MAFCVQKGISEKNLNDLYADPYIQQVGHDLRPASPVYHPLATYLSAFVNGVFAGAFLLIRAAKNDFEIHSLLKKEFVRHSRALGSMAVEWAFRDPSVNRVTALIVDWLPKAVNFAKKVGFTHEGVKRGGVIKNGKPRDIIMLGMLRSEYKS